MYNTILSLVDSLSLYGLDDDVFSSSGSCSLSFWDIVPFPVYIHFSGVSLPQQSGILSPLERAHTRSLTKLENKTGSVHAKQDDRQSLLGLNVDGTTCISLALCRTALNDLKRIIHLR